MQSQFLAAMSIAGGESVITENIFENRFHVVEPLRKMGARIWTEGKNVYVEGVHRLKGAEVEAAELRGGAALVMAGLGAIGHTRVTGCSYIHRGYENIGRDLRELGARVYSI
jgi:UDP-N-acetylglucosamine 1-carboxyvinyltransferase